MVSWLVYNLKNFLVVWNPTLYSLLTFNICFAHISADCYSVKCHGAMFILITDIFMSSTSFKINQVDVNK
jgi:hypothetical protein